MIPNLKITAIASVAAILMGLAVGVYFTRDHYLGVIAEKDDAQQKALEAAQTKANATAAFATTVSNLRVTQISTKYEKELADAKAQHDLDDSRLHAGSLRLRDKSATCRSQSAESTAGSSSSVPADSAGAELSVPASEFLLGEADRADDTVRKLNACAAVVRSDRDVVEKILNGQISTPEALNRLDAAGGMQ